GLSMQSAFCLFHNRCRRQSGVFLLIGHEIGFSSLRQTGEQQELRVSGNLPAWLTGTLLRTGPALFEIGQQSYRHWFDGLAMLHRFSFRENRVLYTNRFLESQSFRKAQEQQRIVVREFGTDP